MTDITGKTCLVTGGAGGLGKAIATRFLAANANIVICDINEARLQETETELSGTSSAGKVKAIKADITSAAAVQTLFDEIVATFGKVDILVNNAGIMDRFDPVGDLDASLWDKVIAVNLTAPFLLSKLAVQNMLAQEKVEGNIVNIVSLAGRGGGVAGAAYTASKHGLVGLTKNTAVAYGNKGIRCNALMMGGMDTNITEAFMAGINREGMERIEQLMQAMRIPMCPLGEVAEVVFTLTCGPGARLMNGNCVPVDNGFSAVA
ncbi:SDR family NAD(P)-dependent oxidoreductase [Aspergillus candidus]|uniref:NAD(P)-binding protein n=1 Tax=Aspergillus candidus TaxID=41067 RepID=A0A2I2FPT5_ASPCN|nr:NAD(P)-binding protein [Aspergillus candidus]PLB42621.1 NAD(P)-binding protein [Aspergillus candidus]